MHRSNGTHLLNISLANCTTSIVDRKQTSSTQLGGKNSANLASKKKQNILRVEEERARWGDAWNTNIQLGSSNQTNVNVPSLNSKEPWMGCSVGASDLLQEWKLVAWPSKENEPFTVGVYGRMNLLINKEYRFCTMLSRQYLPTYLHQFWVVSDNWKDSNFDRRQQLIQM